MLCYASFFYLFFPSAWAFGRGASYNFTTHEQNPAANTTSHARHRHKSPVPPVILKHRVLPGLDRHCVEMLEPKSELSMSFGAPTPHQGPQDVLLHVPLTRYPIVQLQNSIHVVGFECEAEGMGRVAFDDTVFARWAFDRWSHFESEFVLVSNSAACGSQDEHGQAYMLCRTPLLDPASKSVILQTEQVPFRNVVDAQADLSVTMKDWKLGHFPTLRTHDKPPDNFSFDKWLDGQAGFFNNTQVAQESLFPNDNATLFRRGHQKRWSWNWVWQYALKPVVRAIERMAGGPKTREIRENIAHAIYPHSVDTGFGEKGLLLADIGEHSKVLKLYCVNCGVSVQLEMQGTYVFSFADGLKEGTLRFLGSAALELALGVVLDQTFHYSVSTDIISIPLTPFTIPGIINIGPEISVSVGADLNMHAGGHFKVGGRTDWSLLNITYHIHNGSSSTSNASKFHFTPLALIKPAEGLKSKLDVSVDAHAKLALGLGLDILSGLCKEEIALVEQTSILFAYEKDLDETEPCPFGVASTSLKSSLYIDVLGRATLPLAETIWPVASKCLQYSAEPNPSAGDRVILSSADKQYSIVPHDDGNLYVEPTNATRPTAERIGLKTERGADGHLLRAVIRDSRDRVLHAYSDELDAWGTSRLRLSDTQHVPRNSKSIILTQASARDLDLDYLVALDIEGTQYLPAVCTFATQPARLLVTSSASNLSRFTSWSNVSQVLGHAPVDCGLLGTTLTWAEG